MTSVLSIYMVLVWRRLYKILYLVSGVSGASEPGGGQRQVEGSAATRGDELWTARATAAARLCARHQRLGQVVRSTLYARPETAWENWNRTRTRSHQLTGKQGLCYTIAVLCSYKLLDDVLLHMYIPVLVQVCTLHTSAEHLSITGLDKSQEMWLVANIICLYI